MQEALNFIDGRHAAAEGGEWLDDVDPALGEPYARIASSDGRDVDRAVAAAERAFPAWSGAAAAARWPASRPGTSRSTCSPGRWSLRWRQETRWSPSPPR